MEGGPSGGLVCGEASSGSAPLDQYGYTDSATEKWKIIEYKNNKLHMHHNTIRRRRVRLGGHEVSVTLVDAM